MNRPQNRRMGAFVLPLLLGLALLALEAVEPSATARATRAGLTVALAGTAWMALRRPRLPESEPEAESRSENRSEERVSPFQIVEDVRRDLQELVLAKQIVFQVEYLSPIPDTVRLDGPRLSRALAGIARRALAATDRGTVLVLIRAPLEGDEIRLEFVFVDAGSGFSGVELARLFHERARREAAVDDALALADVEEVVRQLGGALSIRRWPGFGTVFQLDVPAGAAVDARFFDPPAATFPSAAPAQELSGLRALVADDTAVNRKLLSHVLSRDGAIVTTAADGVEAVELARGAATRGEPFDVILLDIHMPRLDGFDAARQMRALGLEAPILAVTADATLGGLAEFLAAGFDGHCTKPIDRPLLLGQIRALRGNVRV